MSIQRLSEAITDAINAAGGDPTHPKWGHVSRLVKLGCTSRGYVGAAPGVRVGDTRKVIIHDVHWMLPETEEEWRDYERKWGHKFQRDLATGGRVSKYWRQPSEEPLEHEPPKVSQLGGTKFELVQEKVTAWQATVPPAKGGPSGSNTTEVPHPPKNTDKGKAKVKAKTVEASGSQGSLGFSVVKRSGITVGKPEKRSHTQHGGTVVEMPMPSVDMRMSSPIAPEHWSTPEGAGRITSTSETIHGIGNQGIEELSEMVSA